MKIRGAKRVQKLIEKPQGKSAAVQETDPLSGVTSSSPDAISLRWKSPDIPALEELFDKFGFGNFRRERWLDMLRA